MAFLKRLGFYLIGLSIGLVFLFFFLKKKSDETGVSFCYLPNCRVLKELRSKPLIYSKQVDQMVAERVLDSLTIAYFLNEGDVNFKKSITKNTTCKTYLIEGMVKEKFMALTVKNCDSTILIDDLQTMD
ncbi:DUF4258 domain-containing protein [uncultured Eudoraea sp.]|jgi:hypothetical protein|uniref:DUF4258 domain-containing protein n=1 Tax=uncultured Eudoraea sp. TaxID=1035614 RepID=UPI00261003AE|nr:DUF4258 domain-containing protein [uncultured Eudoraea sp.]